MHRYTKTCCSMGAIIIMPPLFHPLTMHIRICKLGIDFLLALITSLLNSSCGYVWPEVKCSGSLMFVQKRARELQRRPACRDQLKHDVDRHLSLMHWSILAGCEHQGETITSRWALLPSSLQKRLSSTQPVPEDVFLVFNLISVSRITWILNNYSSKVVVLLFGISCKRLAKMGSKLPQIWVSVDDVWCTGIKSIRYSHICHMFLSNYMLHEYVSYSLK